MKEGPSLARGGGPRLDRGRFVRLLAPLLLTSMLLLAGCGPSASTTTSVSVDPATTSTATPTTAAPSSLGSSSGMRTADVDRPLLVGNFAICSDCHGLLDRSASSNPALVKAFAHAPHLAEGAKCDECHLVPTHTTEGVRRPTMQKCFGCHSLNKPSTPPGECSACHPPSFPLTPASHRDPRWLPSQDELVSVRATHSEEAAQPDNGCGLCHAPTFCQDCHGVDMPHPENWQDDHSDEAATVGGQVCLRCHPDSESCSACHHPGYKPGGSPWWQVHPIAVQNNGATFCLRCHSTLTCAHCHTTGEYKVF